MKRHGILNAQLSRIIASLGHTDTIVIADCGLPIPPSVECVDLAVVQGLPRFKQVVEAIAEELAVQKVLVAEEMETQNAEAFSFVRRQFSGIPVEKIPHEALKERLSQAKAVVRTGEATPFANVILECGVTF